jgi:hypothetical protein
VGEVGAIAGDDDIEIAEPMTQRGIAQSPAYQMAGPALRHFA